MVQGAEASCTAMLCQKRDSLFRILDGLGHRPPLQCVPHFGVQTVCGPSRLRFAQPPRSFAGSGVRIDVVLYSIVYSDKLHPLIPLFTLTQIKRGSIYETLNPLRKGS